MSANGYKKQITIYEDLRTAKRAQVLYFHGGGLLYGNREDLPQRHIETLTESGISIAACDYPLAPAVKIDEILEDVCATIRETADGSLPYFLWGRSAGAYLCLLAAVSGRIPAPAGVISYYGYGLLCDHWFQSPSRFYKKLPEVTAECLDGLKETVRMEGALDTHYSAYVYARQTGQWLNMIYEGKEKLFYLYYTLRTCKTFPYPLFCAHSTQDPDVPYEEFLVMTQRFEAKRFVAVGPEHDFDRDPFNGTTEELLAETRQFIFSLFPASTEDKQSGHLRSAIGGHDVH